MDDIHLQSDDSFFVEEEEQPTISLDENGFPQHLLQSDDKADQEEQNPVGSFKEKSFSEEFYRCGTDWSALRLLNDSKSDCKKKMKQIDLFQTWGINRPKTVGEDYVGSKGVKCKQIDLFQMWGLKNQMKVQEDNVNSKENQTKSAQLGSEQGDFPSFSEDFGVPDESFGVISEKGQKRKTRACPFYKKLPGTSFTVDAFRYGAIKGCSAYFLSHFHADHYGGLSKAWSHGPIYCTPITARLVRMCLYVNPLFICPLELDIEYDISGVKVTFLEANHCPGAALIHFHLPGGQCYLHTGDFRACKIMQTYPFSFPSKEEVTSFVVRTTKACLKKQPRTLVVVGAYSIGKECVYVAISEALKVKIHANASRRRILKSFDWPHLSENLCSHGKDTPLHVLPISSLRHETLKNYLKIYKDQFAAVVAFRPTGWTFSESIGDQLDLIKPNSKGNIQIYGVPYSEHSSFTELQEFVQFLKPKKIIATVNISNAATREKQQSYFRQWLNG